MIDDIHEPLQLYRESFKDTHAANTAAFFEELVRRSGVDEAANQATVRELCHLEQQLAQATSSNSLWRLLRWTAIASFVGTLGYAYLHRGWWLIAAAGLIFALALVKLNQLISNASERIKRLEQQRDDKRGEAWQQMAQLNRLHDWDTVARLLQQTVPRIAFDPYFTQGRLQELQEAFQWSGNFNDGRSIVFAHSGELNGNPFVVAQTLDHWMGTKTYEGSLQITWTEEVRGSDGKLHTETRHETLYASLEHPFPEFGHRTFIIYGNEAAPDLSFSRSPSKLSGLDEGLLNSWKKRRAIKKLESVSRDIDKSFTVMANREFDALFGATDRDHEVQFRLLFTPLAQQEMLKLLKDSSTGYGDDFAFIKQRMVNIVEPAHMRQTDISADPRLFQHYELTHARKFFNDYHNDFFRSLFFGIAPLLAIPLYQQHRSHADIYKDTHASRSCFWEHEAIANFYGEQRFQHPECVTRSILKTRAQVRADGQQTVQVTASGYRSEERLTYVDVMGGDGHMHQVPVHWAEYFDVDRDSTMLVREQARPGVDENATAVPMTTDAILRRSIVSTLVDD